MINTPTPPKGKGGREEVVVREHDLAPEAQTADRVKPDVVRMARASRPQGIRARLLEELPEGGWASMAKRNIVDLRVGR